MATEQEHNEIKKDAIEILLGQNTSDTAGRKVAESTDQLFREELGASQRSSTSSLPALSLDGTKSMGVLKEFGESLLHSLIQSPLEGLAQGFDKTIGSSFDSKLYSATKNLVIEAPAPAEFASSEWHAQVVGGAIGVIPLFMLVRGRLRAAAENFGATRALVASPEMVMANRKVFSSTGMKVMFEGGMTGASYAALFKPVEEGQGNYWEAKAKHIVTDFATFGTLSAGSLWLAPRLNPMTVSMAQKFPNLTLATDKTSAVLAGGLSGLPASVVNTSVDHALFENKPALTAEEFAKNAYTFIFTGAALSALHPVPGSPRKSTEIKSALIKSEERHVKRPEGQSKSSDSVPKSSDSLSTAALSKSLDRLPNAFDFKQLVGENRVGKLPDAFLEAGVKPGEAFAKLDALANALRELDAILPPQKKSGLGATDLKLPTFQFQLGFEKVEVSKVAIGEVAHVYKLSIDGKDYAFKVPNDPARMDIHGSYSEVAAFTYLSKHKVSDLVEFHAANPSPKGGWILTEFVSKPVQKEGSTIQEVLAKSGLELSDDWSANRGPGNVVWDLGGIEPKGIKYPTSLTELQNLLATSEGQFAAARKLSGIKDQAELKQALLLCLSYESISGQVARSAVKFLHSSADLNDVLSKSLETKGAAGRAAFELDAMADTPYMTALFYKALKNPESRVEAVKHLDKLPASERKAAFDAAFEYPEARPMATRSVVSITDPIELGAAAAKAAQDPGSLYLLYQNLSRYQPLTESELQTRQKSFEEYFQSHGLDILEKEGIRAVKLSFDSWMQKMQNNQDFNYELSSNTIQQLKAVWNELTEGQKQLPYRDLVILSKSWNYLTAQQWRKLSPEESVLQANLSRTMSLNAGEAARLSETPDFKNEAAKNRLEGNYVDLADSFARWNEIPAQFKSLSAPAPGTGLYNYGSPASSWAKLAPNDALNVAKALSLMPGSSVQARKIADNPDFAKLLSDFGNKPFDLNGARKVLDTWEYLTAEQRKLPLEQLLQLLSNAKLLVVQRRLEAEFGTDSHVPKFLIAMESQFQAQKRPFSVKDIEQALYDVEFQNPSFRDSSKKIAMKDLIERMVKGNGTALEFSPDVLLLNLHFSDKPSMRSRILELVNSDVRTKGLLEFINENPSANQPIVEMLLQQQLSGVKLDFYRLREVADISKKLNLDEQGKTNLVRLFADGLNVSELRSFIYANPSRSDYVKALIDQNADKGLLQVKRLNDLESISKLDAFSASEKKQIQVLFTQGLSIMRLKNHLQADPHRVEAVRSLLSQGADLTELNNYMRLSAFPDSVALPLVQATKLGLIRTEDVVGKVSDWNSGSYFQQLLTRHVGKNKNLNEAELSKLDAEAKQMARAGAGNLGSGFFSSGLKFKSPAKPSDEVTAKSAKSFVEAADNIIKTIPHDKNIVLLGRDAWPLVPLLRAKGRDVQYFLWSRLQNNDQATQIQWLKETRPNSVVIDTGYAGSIIDAIRKIDPGVTGYLMSSEVHRYPGLLQASDARARVGEIEALPKPISRTKSHTEKGGAISRRSGDSDVDTQHTAEGKNRWYVERRSRELLRATGLPEWDVWRYSTFYGLTPKERLGLSTKEEVDNHFKMVLEQRKKQGKQSQY